MSRSLFGCVVAAALALATTVVAQTPPPQSPPPQNPPAASSMQDQAKLVTVEGCLAREADVPGRKPNVAERAGVTEDFILTDTKMIKGSAPSAGSAQAKPGETPTGTAGTRALMYEVEGIDGDKLKQHAGRRVQIEGTFANVERARGGAPGDALVELRGSVIRQVPGDCPPKP